MYSFVLWGGHTEDLKHIMGCFHRFWLKKKKYLTEEELTEMIGLFALVPGPASTQTITAIGYYAGGPILALLTFLVWVLPAIVTMGLIGVFFYSN